MMIIFMSLDTVFHGPDVRDISYMPSEENSEPSSPSSQRHLPVTTDIWDDGTPGRGETSRSCLQTSVSSIDILDVV
jgi:hypothetical protein